MDHEIKVNGHRFKVSIRDIVQVGATALSIVGIYFISSGRINSAEASISDLQKKYEELAKRVEKMDENGTRRSHEVDATQQQMIDYNVVQINDLNRQMRDLTPKVDKIDTNVLWLMAKQLEKR